MESVLIVIVLFVILGFGLALIRTRSTTHRRSLSPPPGTVLEGRQGDRRLGAKDRSREHDDQPDATDTDEELPSSDDGDRWEAGHEPPTDAEAPMSLDASGEGSQLAAVAPEEGLRDRATMSSSLARSRGPFASLFSRLRSGDAGVEPAEWTRLEETLILSDMGPALASDLVAELRTQLGKSPTEATLRAALVAALEGKFLDQPRELALSSNGKPSVVLVVGVNGTGKTTTIGKIANLFTTGGRSVMIAAGDTFRAAATEQVGVWAALTGVEVVSGQPGADPASVIFDAVEHARAVGSDVVLCDTAGRLQTKTNLMEELKKIRRVAAKSSGEVTEVLLVIDATTGQNGLRQAEVFHDAAEVTGVVLAKLDGSAKGGVALAIESQFGLPIKLVGLGEGLSDLAPFDPKAFVAALVGEDSDV